MSISLTVNKFFDPVMNLAKSSLAKIYQVLPAPAQKFFLGIATTKASPEVLKGLHADVSASEHAKALSKELNRLLLKVGDTVVFFSDPRQAGPYGIPNTLQKILSSNPLPDELKAKFKEQGLNVDEYLSMALNPTHTGLVLKIPPSSDNPEGLLFIHIDLRSQQPSKDNLSPYNGELKMESLGEVVKRAIDFGTDFQFFKVGHIENITNFLDELKNIRYPYEEINLKSFYYENKKIINKLKLDILNDIAKPYIIYLLGNKDYQTMLKYSDSKQYIDVFVKNIDKIQKGLNKKDFQTLWSDLHDEYVKLSDKKWFGKMSDIEQYIVKSEKKQLR